jgi:signal transduction histidine kinase
MVRVTAAVKRWPLLGRLSVVVLVVMVGLAIAFAVVTNNVIDDQERKLTEERGAEAAALLSNAVSMSGSTLRLLGTVSQLGTGSAEVFTSTAQPFVQATVKSFSVVQQDAAGFTVAVSVGDAPAAEQPVTGPRADLATRALGTPLMVTALIGDGGPETRLVLALALGGDTNAVVLEEVAVNPSVVTPRTPASPFGDLDAKVYASPDADPAKLLLGNVAGQPRGTVASTPVTVGADTWLLVVGSPKPLVGEFANYFSWIVLGIGLLAAALTTVVIEILARRRSYAMTLVEERTVALREAMDDLRDTQAQLVRTERLAAVGELAAAIGHELRNPLGVVSNIFYLIETGLGDNADEKMRRRVDTGRREVAAATLIVSDLLDYAAAREPMLAAVDLPELVVEALSVAPPPQGIDVVQTLADVPDDLVADRDQLRQAILNLITNGYQAMPSGGVLTVETVVLPGSLQIIVSDTGVGMDDETKERLFTPFFTRRARGIGLGLAVTKRIIEAHGGSIDVHSTLGQGATFVVTLPLAERALEASR